MKMIQPNFATMLCIPCGSTREEVIASQEAFKTNFVEYLESKQVAGIANIVQAVGNIVLSLLMAVSTLFLLSSKSVFRRESACYCVIRESSVFVQLDRCKNSFTDRLIAKNAFAKMFYLTQVDQRDVIDMPDSCIHRNFIRI